MPVIIALFLVVGVSLGLLGGGGSILTVPLLVYGLHMDAKPAIAMSLVVVGATSAVALARHARRGNVAWREGLIFGLAGSVGAYAGGLAAAWIPSHVLLLILAAVMIISGLAMLRRRGYPVEPHGRGACAGRCMVLRILLPGLGMGAVTGLVGAGRGFLIVPALVLLGRLPMHTAVGTSLLVITLNTMAGLAGHIGHIDIDYALTAAVTGSAIIGTFGGTWLAHRIPAQGLRKGFAWFVIATAFYLVYREAWSPAWIAGVLQAYPEIGVSLGLLALSLVGMWLLYRLHMQRNP